MILIRKIAVLIMAVFTLLLSSRATVSGHFCGSILQDVKFMNSADPCGMESQSACELPNIQKTSCCQDTHFHIKGQDLEKAASTPAPVLAATLLLFTPLKLHLTVLPMQSLIRVEPPDLFAPALHKLLETFRI